MTTAPAAGNPCNRVARVPAVLATAVAMTALLLSACSADTDQDPVVIQPTEVGLVDQGPTAAPATSESTTSQPATQAPATSAPAATEAAPTAGPTAVPAPPPNPLQAPTTTPADLARDLGVDGLVGLLDDLIESNEDWAQVIGPRGRDLRDDLDDLGRRPKDKDVESTVERLDRWLADNQIDAEFGQAVRVVLTELPTRNDGNPDGNNADENDDDDD